MTGFDARARALIGAGYCGTCKRLCGGHVICGTSEYPCDYPVWEPLRQNDELFVSAISSALKEAVEGEREACAKIVDNTAEVFAGEVYVDPDPQYNSPEHRQRFVHEMITVCASAIRSRKETPDV